MLSRHDHVLAQHDRQSTNKFVQAPQKQSWRRRIPCQTLFSDGGGARWQVKPGILGNDSIRSEAQGVQPGVCALLALRHASTSPIQASCAVIGMIFVSPLAPNAPPSLALVQSFRERSDGRLLTSRASCAFFFVEMICAELWTDTYVYVCVRIGDYMGHGTVQRLIARCSWPPRAASELTRLAPGAVIMTATGLSWPGRRRPDENHNSVRSSGRRWTGSLLGSEEERDNGSLTASRIRNAIECSSKAHDRGMGLLGIGKPLRQIIYSRDKNQISLPVE